MMRNLFFCLLIVLPGFIAAQEKSEINLKEKLKAITNSYFMAYNEHNVEKIIRFYADTCVLVDDALDNELKGRREFYRVARAAFEGTSPLYKDLFFKVASMEQEGWRIIVKGEMQNLQWNRGFPESWRFKSHIDYNEKGKIVKQTDFVEYPKDVYQYMKKVNRND